MKIKDALIMNIGTTENNIEITKKMVKRSINSFLNVPIVHNREQAKKSYGNIDEEYLKGKVIGVIVSKPKVKGNKVVADIELRDECAHLWKGRYANWCIQLFDDMKSFTAMSIEVF